MYSHAKRHFILAIALCSIALMVFTGCSSTSKNPTSEPEPPANSNVTPNTEDSNLNGNTSDEKQDNLPTDKQDNMEERAKTIADAIIEDIPEVKDARVLISETKAYAALDIERTADTAEAEELKDKVVALIKETDSEITDAVVTEDADTFSRFGEIGKDIANGKPISGFMEEIENFFVRITPGN